MTAAFLGVFSEKTLSYFAQLRQGAPVSDWVQNPVLYFSDPSEMLTAGALNSENTLDVDLVYNTHRFVFNPVTQLTELVVFCQPLVSRLRSLAEAFTDDGSIESALAKPNTKFTPYFVLLLDPMRSSTVRNYCNQLGYSLYQDKARLGVTVSSFDDNPSSPFRDALKNFNAETAGQNLPRI